MTKQFEDLNDWFDRTEKEMKQRMKEEQGVMDDGQAKRQ